MPITSNATSNTHVLTQANGEALDDEEDDDEDDVDDIPAAVGDDEDDDDVYDIDDSEDDGEAQDDDEDEEDEDGEGGEEDVKAHRDLLRDFYKVRPSLPSSRPASMFKEIEHGR